MMTQITQDNLLSIVITYNPDSEISSLLSRLLAFSKHVVVVDNGSENIKDIRKWIAPFTAVVLVENGDNRGIAEAINQGITVGLNDEIKWVLTFDQDSIPSPFLIQCYNQVVSVESKVGLIGCAFGQPSPENVFISYRDEIDLISSGMLQNIEIFKNVGMYDDRLFIDYVDIEMSLRVRCAGYKTLKILNPLMSHQLGKRETVHMFGKNKEITTHTALRQYYIYRNHIVIAKTYFLKQPKFVLHKTWMLVKSVVSIALYEHFDKEKLKMVCIGLYDGFANHLGRYD